MISPWAGVEEMVRLYDLRMWVEQSYKQVKHALGWSHYPGSERHGHKKTLAVVVCCAFSFCWGVFGRLLIEEVTRPEKDLSTESMEREKEAPSVMAGGAPVGKGVARTMRAIFPLITNYR